MATQTYVAGAEGQPQIVVGVPIPSVHAAYFEVFSLSDLGHTLRVLGITLVATAVATTLLGTALGRFASRRLLRPLAGVSRAAVAIAGGQLDTRLGSETTDPDLEGLTTSFNTMVDQLQARIELEARFNSDVSHELRSPLTTLSASLEVLEADRDNLPQRAQRALQLLGDDLRRFQRMVSDLLEMSRADTGSADVFLEQVNVGELVQRSVEAGLRSLGDGGTTPALVIDPAVAPLHVGVDKRRFERVMANLLENAAHYGGGATRISVGANGKSAVDGAPGGERHNGADEIVEIAVEDAGPGINPAERTKVFDRFYRGSASGRRGDGTGTGLGLALVAEHMRLMHGRAWVESSPSGGSPLRHHPARARRRRRGDGVVGRRAALCAVVVGRACRCGLRHPDPAQPERHPGQPRARRAPQPHHHDHPTARGGGARQGLSAGVGAAAGGGAACRAGPGPLDLHHHRHAGRADR